MKQKKKKKGKTRHANIYHKNHTLTNLTSYLISPEPYHSLERVMPLKKNSSILLAARYILTKPHCSWDNHTIPFSSFIFTFKVVTKISYKLKIRVHECNQ